MARNQRQPVKIFRTPIFVIRAIGIIVLFIFEITARRVEAAKEAFYNAQKQLELYQSEIWHSRELNKGDLNEKLKSELARYPVKGALTSVIEEITQTAKKAAVSFEGITPKDTMEVNEENDLYVPGLGLTPLEMRLRGSYEQLSVFLSGLRDLKSGVVRTSQFELLPHPSTKGELNLSLLGVVYAKKSEDQILFGDEKLPPVSKQPVKSRFKIFGRDPFFNISKGIKTHQIEGIIYDPVKPMAMIDGELRGIGDMAGSQKIVEIWPNGIVVEENGKRIERKLR